MRLVDASGAPLNWNRLGFVYLDGHDNTVRSQNHQVRKAELSARWKGGLQDGDPVHMGDRNLEVVGHNPKNNKLVLADTDMVDGDQLKSDAYKEYKKHLSGAWKKQKEPSEREWEVSGPLSDSQREDIKEAAWRDSVEELSNAWRK